MRTKKILRIKNKGTFLLKPDFMLWHTIELLDANVERFKVDWLERYNSSPAMFLEMPIIIDVSHITQQNELDLEQVCHILLTCQVSPVGIRGLSEQHYDQAKKQGLNLLRPRVRANNAESLQCKKKTPDMNTAKIISEPIRSGTRLYAENRDLIILSSVNAGAEVISDGNIHIYGPLRGRVLAGASGNEQARIFCQTLDAELVSIAGYYLVKEEIPAGLHNQRMAHIKLKNERLIIEDI